jgi:hypothetical protein
VGTNRKGSGAGRIIKKNIATADDDEVDEERNLKRSEFELLTRFVVEAAIPDADKLFCPACERMCLLEDAPSPRARGSRKRPQAQGGGALGGLGGFFSRSYSSSSSSSSSSNGGERGGGAAAAAAAAEDDETTAGGQRVPDALQVCPHCDHRWNPREAMGEDAATKRFLDATSKRCPTCGVRTSHYHGHDCHHIGYGSNGCPQCRQHWCKLVLTPLLFCTQHLYTPPNSYI